MNNSIAKLTAYHSNPKVKNGIEYIVLPEPAAAITPVAEDPKIKAMQQTATAFWQLSKIHKELAGKL